MWGNLSHLSGGVQARPLSSSSRRRWISDAPRTGEEGPRARCNFHPTARNRLRIQTTLESPEKTSSWDRRKFLGRSSAVLLTAGAVASVRAQDIPKVTKAQHDRSSTNPGPENEPLKNANPNVFTPPPTDHGEVETFWSSFSVAHRRVQEGGWTRQVTVEDFPISMSPDDCELMRVHHIKDLGRARTR